jgi:hypothetical protein
MSLGFNRQFQLTLVSVDFRRYLFEAAHPLLPAEFSRDRTEEVPQLGPVLALASLRGLRCFRNWELIPARACPKTPSRHQPQGIDSTTPKFPD